MDIQNEIQNETFNETQNENNKIIVTEQSHTPSEMTENAKLIAEAVSGRIKSGEVNFSDASKELAHALMTAKAFEPENKKIY